MKTVLSKILFITIVTILSLSSFNTSYATENTKSINLKIINTDATILDQQIYLPESCIVTNSNNTTSTFSGFKAICALQQSLEDNQIDSFKVTDWDWGFSLDAINDIENTSDWSQSWILKKNNNDADVGIADLILEDNDTLTLIYDSWPQGILDIYSSTTYMYANESVNIESLVWNTDSFVTNTTAITFYINGESVETNNGIFTFTPENTGTYEFYVDSTNALASKKINIEVNEPEILATTTIHLQIETYNQEMYNDNFTIKACPNEENSIENTLNAWCAIQQIAEANNWTISGNWYGDQVFLNKINDYDSSDSNYWLWYYNEYIPGSTGLNKKLLEELEVSSSTPIINTTTTIQIKESKGYDENWNEIFSNSTSSTIFINNEEFFDEDGIYKLNITTTTPYTIYAQKNGFITSEILLITPTKNIVEEEEETENNNSGSSGGYSNLADNTPTSAQITEAINKILNYFKTQQNEDGSILDGGTSDWIAMSFGANGQYAKDIKNATSGTSLYDYIYNYDFTGFTDLNFCAGYPRHVMALLASGVASSDEKIVNLKNKILSEECYNNNLYGYDGINDDIFALISLLALDHDKDSEIINDLINKILNTKKDNNSFGDNDITGAVINALSYAKTKNINIEDEIINKAKNYLKSTQRQEGGWSDSITTSWVLMGLNPENTEINSLKTQSGYNPFNLLIKENSDIFSLKHNVPALLGKTWPIILDPIIQPTNNVGGGSIETNTTSTTATSTEEIVTSTPEIIDDIETSTQKQEIEILPIILELPVENIQTTKTPIAETKLTKQSLIAKNNLEQVLGEKTETTSEDKIIEEEKQNIQTNETIEKIKENEDKNLPTNKKVALALGAGTLLYGLYLLFKLFA